MNTEEMIRKQQYQLLLKQMKMLQNEIDELEDDYQMAKSQVEKSIMVDRHIGFEKEFETIQNSQTALKQYLIYDIISMISKKI